MLKRALHRSPVLLPTPATAPGTGATTAARPPYADEFCSISQRIAIRLQRIAIRVFGPCRARTGRTGSDANGGHFCLTINGTALEPCHCQQAVNVH